MRIITKIAYNGLYLDLHPLETLAKPWEKSDEFWEAFPAYFCGNQRTSKLVVTVPHRLIYYNILSNSATRILPIFPRN